MLVHRHLFISDIIKHQCTGCSAGSAGLQRTSPGPAIGLLLGSLAPVHCPPHRRLVPSLQSQKHQRSENNNQARTGGIPLNSTKNCHCETVEGQQVSDLVFLQLLPPLVLHSSSSPVLFNPLLLQLFPLLLQLPLVVLPGPLLTCLPLRLLDG